MTLWMAMPAYADKWTDITGRHSVEAEFVGLESGVVTLKKQNGHDVRVPLEKLSAEDQRRARDLNNQLSAGGEPDESSKWTDVSGKYSTEAAFVSIESGTVTLKRKDGAAVIIPLEKLSAADQQRAIELAKHADTTAPSKAMTQERTADPNGSDSSACLGTQWAPMEVMQIGFWTRDVFDLIRDGKLWAWMPSNDGDQGDTTAAADGSSRNSTPRGLLYRVLKPVMSATDADIKVPANFMYVRFSKPFLEKYFCTHIDRTMPVRDTILGASVSGTSRTIADSTLELANNESQAQAKLRLVGTNWFQTVAASGPIRIYSRGTTAFTSTEQIWFDGLNLRHRDDGCVAQTRTATTGINSCLRFVFRRISLRIASRREAQTHSLSESITADHTKQRVERAFDSRVADRSTAFQELLKTRYAKLPFEGQFKITDIRCSTSPTHLQIVVFADCDDPSFFVPEPAALTDQPDIELDIHTALVRKAIADPELKKTLEDAAANLIDRPVQGLASSLTSKASSPDDQGPTFHWPEGSNSNWFTISWNLKTK
jgi:hypothetical protein